MRRKESQNLCKVPWNKKKTLRVLLNNLEQLLTQEVANNFIKVT